MKNVYKTEKEWVSFYSMVIKYSRKTTKQKNGIKQLAFWSNQSVNDAWVLRLREESKDGEPGDFYYADDNEIDDFVTPDLNRASIIRDKEKAIKEMKNHESYMKKRFGDNAVCNAGYTNMMKHFEFVEVELKTV